MWSAGSARSVAYDTANARNELPGWNESGTHTAAFYDANGNYAGNGVNSFAVHDSQNRMMSHATAGSGGSFVYGPLGRRIETTLNGQRVRYLHAGDMEIAELVEGLGGWAVRVRYIPGAGIDQRVAMVLVNPATGAVTAREYYHADRLGSVIAMAADLPDAQGEYLFSESIWVSSAPDDPLAGTRQPVTLADIAGRELLSLGRGHRLTRIAEQIADAAGCRISAEYEGTSLDALRLMATTGVGLAVLPGLYATREARRDPDLMVRRIDWPGASRDLSLIWRRTSPLAGSFRQIAAILRATAAQLPSEAFFHEA